MVRIGMWNLGRQSGNGGEGCEALRKSMIDACFVQEVRWRGQGARMLRTKGTRYKLWWSGKGDGVSSVGEMVKELCVKVEEVRMVSDRVMTVVAVLEEDVLRLICGYALHRKTL